MFEEQIIGQKQGTVHFLRGRGAGGIFELSLRSCMPPPSVNKFFPMAPRPNKVRFFLVTPPPKKKVKENSIKPAMHTVQLTKPSF